MIHTTVEFIPIGCALLVVCIVGLTWNCLSIVVLSSPCMKSTYSVFTLGLTLSDSVYLLMKLLRFGICSLLEHYQIGQESYYVSKFIPVFGPSMRAITFTAHTASTYFTVAVTVDRYVALSWPMKARSLCTRRRAFVMSYLVILMSIAYNIPRWFEFYTAEEEVELPTSDTNETFSPHNNETFSPHNNETITVTILTMKISKLRIDENYRSLYIFWTYLIVMFAVPFVSLVLMNLSIYREVKSSNNTRRKLTSFQKREISFAIMSISIVVLFFSTSTVYLVLDILAYCNVSYPSFWQEMGNFLLTLNSAGNFVVYCLFGKKFRNELMRMTFKRCKRFKCLQQWGRDDTMFSSGSNFRGTGTDTGTGGNRTCLTTLSVREKPETYISDDLKEDMV